MIDDEIDKILNDLVTIFRRAQNNPILYASKAGDAYNEAVAQLKAMILDARIEELKTFFNGCEVWSNPDGSEPELDVPQKRIDDRIAQLNREKG